MLLPSNPLLRFVNRLAARSPLGEDEKQAILDLPGHPAQIQCNRDFVRLGQRQDHANLVVDGLVGRFGQNRDGARQITALHIGGEMADLHSVVAPEANSALQALTVTTIVHVPHAALWALSHRYRAIADAFWRECVLDAAVLAEWVVNVGRRDARSRMAHLFCEMATRYGAVSGENAFSFDFPVTQDHLADILALTPVHVNRTLKMLREEGLVRAQRRTVDVLDWNRLAWVADFDPAYLAMSSPRRSDPIPNPIDFAFG